MAFETNDIATHLKIEERKIIVNRIAILEKIEELEKITKMDELKEKIEELKKIIQSPKEDKDGILNIDTDGDSLEIDRDVLLGDLNQIEETLTLERAKYYLNRLKKSISEIKTAKINDINLNRWKEYNDIITDSLWIFKERDTSGAHLGWYWGNFIPQIPHQVMLRYTKKGEWVLDAFAGSGTTLIECRRLGRNGIGIELNPDVVEKAKELINKEPNPNNVVSDVFPGDSRTVDLKSILAGYGIKQVQLLIMHPPYHDIIKFNKNDPRDLSNAPTVDAFLKMFGEVVDNTFDILEKERYLVLVIGDKYSKGEWIPLGFKTMEEVLKRGYKLKSIIVKNFEETRAKRNQEELWRYRALVGGFYIFKHEYIMLFKKVKEKV